jgi:hypothetical protein
MKSIVMSDHEFKKKNCWHTPEIVHSDILSADYLDIILSSAIFSERDPKRVL